MNQNEIRYKIISRLLQSNEPLTQERLVALCEMEEADIMPMLKSLINEGLILALDGQETQYVWASRWKQKEQTIIERSRQELQSRITKDKQKADIDINSEPVITFNNFVINEYKPPKDKRFLVFLQCSVRRPFSSSPSHASMKRAIYIATGYDPKKDFERCPVHAVVMASKIGPVPYDLEDVYPANVSSGGVKHFEKKYYERIKPILAERIARYITTHGKCYHHITAFADGRYGEVMDEAREIAHADFTIFPIMGTNEVLRMGKSIPHKYWEKYWIQLCLEIMQWLEPEQRLEAELRLEEMGVIYTRS